MPPNGCPTVPMPRRFLFDAEHIDRSSSSISNPRSCTGAVGAYAEVRSAEQQQSWAARKQSAGDEQGEIANLSGCSVDFLLRSNCSEARSQGLELHISQLRTALLELLHVHKSTEAQVLLHLMTLSAAGFTVDCHSSGQCPE